MNNSNLNVRRVRLVSFAAVAVLHIALILLVVINMETTSRETPPQAGVMRLFDVEEEVPPPPPPPPEAPPPAMTQDPIAEHIIETDEEPPPVAAYVPAAPAPAPSAEIEFLPMHRVTVLPVLPEDQILRNIVYPPIARRSNIEGAVFLELFVDRNGNVRDVRVLRETPPDRGFGDAAINAFRGIRGTPAQADGEAVAVRFRYNLTFRLN